MVLGQDVTKVELINQGSEWTNPALWLPAVVAVAVVLIGGWIQRRLQVSSFEKAAEQFKSQQDEDERRWRRQMSVERERWREQQEFEREKFLLQERRALYARFIAAAQTVLPTVGELATLLTEHTQTDDVQDRLGEELQAMKTVGAEAQMIGSAAFREAAEPIERLIVGAVRRAGSDNDADRQVFVDSNWSGPIDEALIDLTAIGRDELLLDTVGS